VLFLGIAFFAVGAAGEALSGTWFEDFLDPRYPRDRGPWWRGDDVIKIRGGRLFFWLGLVMTVVGGIAELA
jgi:hypothetical protein